MNDNLMNMSLEEFEQELIGDFSKNYSAAFVPGNLSYIGGIKEIANRDQDDPADLAAESMECLNQSTRFDALADKLVIQMDTKLATAMQFSSMAKESIDPFSISTEGAVGDFFKKVFAAIIGAFKKLGQHIANFLRSLMNKVKAIKLSDKTAWCIKNATQIRSAWDSASADKKDRIVKNRNLEFRDGTAGTFVSKTVPKLLISSNVVSATNNIKSILDATISELKSVIAGKDSKTMVSKLKSMLTFFKSERKTSKLGKHKYDMVNALLFDNKDLISKYGEKAVQGYTYLPSPKAAWHYVVYKNVDTIGNMAKNKDYKLSEMNVIDFLKSGVPSVVPAIEQIKKSNKEDMKSIDGTIKSLIKAGKELQKCAIDMEKKETKGKSEFSDIANILISEFRTIRGAGAYVSGTNIYTISIILNLFNTYYSIFKSFYNPKNSSSDKDKK